MLNFFEKVGKFFVKLMIIGLILLISVQLIGQNEQYQERLQIAENFIKSYFNQPVQEVIKVTQQETPGNLEIVEISLISGASIPEVWLMNNGQRIDNFQGGKVRTEVSGGDLLTIDARDYNQILWLEISFISSDIVSFQTGKQFRISGGDLKNLGIIRIRDKL